MSRRLSRLAVPFKVLVDRMTMAVLLVASLLLLVVGKVDLKLIDMASNHAGDLAAPVLGMMAMPVHAARGLAETVGGMLALQEENERLRMQVDRLLAWQAEAARLDVQNRALRRIVDMPPIERAIPVATASIVGDVGGGFIQTRLVDAGSSRGVMVGQAAVDARGLVGRIVAVGQRSARVLLITDMSAKIPVFVDRSGDRALLEGGNDRLPRLRFLPRDPRFALGDRVITSGEGGLLPAGIPVGVISRMASGEVDVTPVADWERLDVVQILRALPVEPPEAALPVQAASIEATSATRLAAELPR
ncbi:MAG TPA: rod shape-determining protein MreC [Geminicoccus sp.]|jgi:rod shape-determining protein MreC|uniref:rod shape-determining protein MreC n=1 Tax=Geminicoccus sp. TaxID=2024832 RepID=UPI002E317128|nr:rod shape-determining protein MreC [Geminicoccus sp.]HEX2527261.1 rod shape-determining protein MreC [Geminicoccus sp.]